MKRDRGGSSSLSSARDADFHEKDLAAIMAALPKIIPSQEELEREAKEKEEAELKKKLEAEKQEAAEKENE